jgi:HlyD family secretion protein
MKFNKKALVLTALAILVLLAGHRLFLSHAGNSEDILTAEVVRTDMTVEVHTVGELDAAESVVLSSSVRGDRGKIIELVEDGKQVETGDVLIRLDPTEFQEEVLRLRSKVIELDALVKAQEELLEWEKNQVEREINRSESDLKIARLELRRLEKGEGPRELARLEAEAAKAREDYEKKQHYQTSLDELVARGFANPTEQEQIRNQIKEAEQAYRMVDMQLSSYRDHLLPVQIEKAKAAITAAEVSLEQTKKGGGHKVGQAMAALAKAEQELVSARQNLERAEQELDATVIKAPSPGMVVLAEQNRGNTFRKPRIGDQVWQNQPLLYLPDISKMIVKTRVREVDLHKIDVGKPVLTTIDAYPDLVLKGRVTAIGVLADQGRDNRRGDRHFSVTVGLDQSTPRLRPGMTARVNIICSRAAGTLVIPVFAVFQEGESSIVFVKGAWGFKKRIVVTGAQNEELVEIKKGLAEGDETALSRPPQFKLQHL